MSHEFYKTLHIVGLIMTFSGLAALVGAYASGNAPDGKWRMVLANIHGLGMLILAVTGLLMFFQISEGFPLWVIGKFVIWLALGGSLALAKRKAQLRGKLILLWTVLGGIATYLALYKPTL